MQSDGKDHAKNDAELNRVGRRSGGPVEAIAASLANHGVQAKTRDLNSIYELETGEELSDPEHGDGLARRHEPAEQNNQTIRVLNAVCGDERNAEPRGQADESTVRGSQLDAVNGPRSCHDVANQDGRAEYQECPDDG
jgi:hypothetical protein